MKNFIKYTVGLPFLLIDTLVLFFCIIMEQIESYLIKGKGISELEIIYWKEVLWDDWKPIK